MTLPEKDEKGYLKLATAGEWTFMGDSPAWDPRNLFELGRTELCYFQYAFTINME